MLATPAPAAACHRQVHFRHAVRHAAIPAGSARHDAKQQFSLLLHQLAATGEPKRHVQSQRGEKPCATAQETDKKFQKAMWGRHAGWPRVDEQGGHCVLRLVRQGWQAIVPQNIIAATGRMMIPFR